MMMKDWTSTRFDINTMGDPTVYDDFIRMSPQGAGDIMHEPYRCPVSTPAGKRRGSKGQPPPPFVAFTNLNRSLQIPKHISVPKHSSHKSLQNKRQLNKPQKKNFDCYFVGKVDNSAYIDKQTRSQPVDEIFGKYKRRSEASNMARSAIRSRSNVETPGEKALLSAWSSNQSQRSSPSLWSRSVKSSYTTGSAAPSRNSWDEPSLRVYGYDSSDPDRIIPTAGFALMPVSPTNQDTNDVFGSPSPRSSFMNYKHTHNNNHNALNEMTSSFDESVYYPYQRDQRFPEIRHRKGAYSPIKKSVKSEPRGSTSPAPSAKQELVESPMHIVSFGSLMTSAKNPKPEESVVSHPMCDYRLPKQAPASLPELQGKG